jgi:hypothetical protein
MACESRAFRVVERHIESAVERGEGVMRMNTMTMTATPITLTEADTAHAPEEIAEIDAKLADCGDRRVWARAEPAAPPTFGRSSGRASLAAARE